MTKKDSLGVRVIKRTMHDNAGIWMDADDYCLYSYYRMKLSFAERHGGNVSFYREMAQLALYLYM